MKYRLVFIGFGIVSQGLIEILINKKDYLKTKYNFEYEVVGVSDMLKGSIANQSGLNEEKLMEIVNNGKKLDEYHNGIKGLNALETINQIDADIMIEATYTNLKTGESATSHCKAAFENNMHVVTTNKGPVALNYHELMKQASAKDLMFGIEGTVMSGTPVINTAQKNLAGCNIIKISGILNGTTNYILTEMEKGNPYDDVLKRAQKLGYAEADPSGDVEGWDALAKVVILSNIIMGGNIKIEDAEREGITKITLDDIAKAKAVGTRWKLIGETSKKDGAIKAKVAPVKLPLSDPLASVMGATNAITFDTDLLGPISIVGRGAGKIETGFSLLSDILAIHRKVSN